ARPALRALSRHTEHQATEEARPHRGRGAAREPPLRVDREDVHAPVTGGRDRRGPRPHLRRAQRARSADRQGGREGRAAPEYGRAEEGAGREARFRLLARASDRFGPAGDIRERPRELELSGQFAAALQREVEFREADDCFVELLLAEVARLLVDLLDVVAVPL